MCDGALESDEDVSRSIPLTIVDEVFRGCRGRPRDDVGADTGEVNVSDPDKDARPERVEAGLGKLSIIPLDGLSIAKKPEVRGILS